MWTLRARGSPSDQASAKASIHVVARYPKCLWLVCAAVLLAGCLPGSLRAQDTEAQPNLLDLSLEDLMKVKIESVYGASGYQQKVTQAPASITIITADDIRRYGYRTLADILRNVRGFYVTYDRNYSYLGVRGFGRPGDYNTRVLVLVDGHRINDNVYGQALIGTEFPVDVDLIDRIEVIRGPNSSLYIASAFLGVVNIITKQTQLARHVTASGELASYGTFNTRLTYGNKFPNGLQMLLSGTYYDSQGHDRLYFKEFDSPLTNHGIAENADGDRARQLFATLSYGNFTVHGVYGSRDKQIPTASFGTVFNDSRTQTVDAEGWVDVQYDRRLANGLGLMTHVYYDNSTYHGTYVYDYSDSGGPSRVLNEDFGWGQWWGANLLLSKKLAERDILTFGAEYQDDFQQQQKNYDLQPYVLYNNSQPTSWIGSVFAQGEFPIRSDLTLNLGLRYDHYSIFGNTVNPRAALIYSPFERTTVKLLYGQSFRAPNMYELYGSGPGTEPNPQLKPETARSTELVFEQYLPKNLQFSLSGFYFPIRDLISEEPGVIPGDLIYRNSQRVNLKGGGVELNWKSPRGLEAGIGINLQDLKLEGNGPPLVNAPRELGVAHLSVPLLKGKVFASMNADYVSRRRTLAGNYAGAYLIPSFTLFSRDAVRGWDFSASVYNAFDSVYGDPGGGEHLQNIIYQDGRNFRVKLAYRF
jgi:outer membrane receptor for ferrienterochelin and colicin